MLCFCIKSVCLVEGYTENTTKGSESNEQRGTVFIFAARSYLAAYVLKKETTINRKEHIICKFIPIVFQHQDTEIYQLIGMTDLFTKV